MLFLLSSFTLIVQHFSPSFAQIAANLVIKQGIASGDVTSTSAVIWSRANRHAEMNVQYDSDHNFSNPRLKQTLVNSSTDYAGHVKLEDLTPSTLYYYRVWFSLIDIGGPTVVSESAIGTFRTAPDQSTRESLNFVVGGDLGGQGFCRRADTGYSIFSVMKEVSPDFFIFNGDQIYPGSECPRYQPQENAIGWKNMEATFPSILSWAVDWKNLAELHQVYLQHWEYNRNDSHLQELLHNTSMYSQFDDHEVINNFGRMWDNLPGEFENRTGYPNLVAVGLSIFSEFSPLSTSEGHFYRSFNWGSDLDLYLLDTRSYRSNNDLLDTPTSNKTLLGKQQTDWLKESLLLSNSTWKVVSTPSSFTIPKCSNETGCDGWATDGSGKSFTRERSGLLKFLDDNNIVNLVFVATDVHFPANIKVQEDFNGDGDDLIFYELVSGPLSARPFDTLGLDPTINAAFLYNESKIFNFSYISIHQDSRDNNVHLVSKVVDDNGIVRPRSVLDLSPQVRNIP